eukprot:m.640762 g.640762  ORF g.640762 m.640762 type:complete len:71 (+) comp22623_c0_seq4:422-634(+)
MGQPEAPGRSGGLQNSSCVHTRVLAGLVALHTLQQADLVAVALDGLRQDLLSAQGVWSRRRAPRRLEAVP